MRKYVVKTYLYFLSLLPADFATDYKNLPIGETMVGMDYLAFIAVRNLKTKTIRVLIEDEIGV